MGSDSHEHCPPAGALHEIVGGVWAWVQPDGSWWLNNAGAVAGVGDDGTHAAGTFIVDTCATFERTTAFLAAVGAATGGAPITTAANTHQHGDHTYGNSVLPRETVIIGHEAMRAGLLEDQIINGCPPVWAPVPDWGAVTRRVPSIAVRDSVTVFNGSRRIELHHPGYAAHTTGDLIAWLPEERVLFSGDLLFHGLTPLVFMGSVGGRTAVARVAGVVRARPRRPRPRPADRRRIARPGARRARPLLPTRRAGGRRRPPGRADSARRRTGVRSRRVRRVVRRRAHRAQHPPRVRRRRGP